MNFSSESVKIKSKSQSEDFYFDMETPRGHFFAVLDFGAHDYANLNATLKGKLETIVGSFVSLTRFSADLFLGFLAKEINNFLSNLSEQGGGPELLGSGALCLVSGNRLSYFLCGAVRMNIFNNGRLIPLSRGDLNSFAGQIKLLGAQNQEAPVIDSIQSFTLQDGDIVLVMSQGLAEALDDSQLVTEIAALKSSDPKLVCERLMSVSSSSADDRTLVVINGPYERHVDPVLADLSKAVTSLSARLDVLESEKQSNVPAPNLELAQQLDAFKDELRSKAARMDLLELDEKIKRLDIALADKVDRATVAGLQNAVSKIEASEQNSLGAKDDGTGQAKTDAVVVQSRSARAFSLTTVLVILIVAIVGAFFGAWLQSRLVKGSPEPEMAAVPIEPQTSQSKTVPAETSQTSPAFPPTAEPAEAVTEITVKSGDSLRRLAARYNIPREKLMALNPNVTNWGRVKIGQRIVVPVEPASNSTASQSPQQSASSDATATTTEVTVAPGDSLNRLALRYKSTPERLRQLNPQITNWSAISTGQKILVPVSPAG